MKNLAVAWIYNRTLPEKNKSTLPVLGQLFETPYNTPFIHLVFRCFPYLITRCVYSAITYDLSRYMEVIHGSFFQEASTYWAMDTVNNSLNWFVLQMTYPFQSYAIYRRPLWEIIIDGVVTAPSSFSRKLFFFVRLKIFYQPNHRATSSLCIFVNHLHVARWMFAWINAIQIWMW